MKDNPFGVWVSASSMASVQLIFDKKKKILSLLKAKFMWVLVYSPILSIF
jgi:hypothetical protein